MENINIASFDFDETKIFQKLDLLSQEIENLNVLREKERKSLAETNKEYNQVSKQMDVLTKTGKGQGKEFDDLVKKQNELILTMVKQRQEISDVTNQTRELTNQSKQLNSILDIQESKQKILNTNYKTESQNVDALRNDRQILIKLRNQEVAVMGEQSEEAKKLNKIIAEMTNQEKKLVSETEKRFYQIGDYAGELQGNFNDLKEAIMQIGSGDVIGGVNALKTSVTGLVTSTLAFVATPVGAVLTALAGFAVVAKYIFDYNNQMAEATKLTQQFTGLIGGELEDVTVRAKNFADQTGADLKEVIRTVNNVAKTYGLTFNEAFDLVENGYVRAGKSAEDFFDNTDEYIQQFKNAGYSAEEFFSILEAGAQKGTYKDKIVDTIKEMDLRLKDFSKSTSDALINAFGQDFTSKLSKGLQSGTVTTKQALKQISDEADKVGLNFQQKQELVAGVFGAMGEDAGGFVKVLDSIQSGLENTNRELTDIEQAQKNVIDATNEYEQAFADLFNVSGGGFEMMKSNFKVLIFNFLTKAIRATIDFANGFIEVYNNSLLVRAAFNAWGGVMKSQSIIVTSALKAIWNGLKSIGNLASSILTFDVKGVRDSIKQGFLGNYEIFKSGVIDLAKNVADTFNSTLTDRLKPISENFGSTSENVEESGTSNVKSRTPVKEKKVKEKKEKVDEAKKQLEKEIELERERLYRIAELESQYAINELNNQIKNNAEKLKNSKRLDEELINQQKELLQTNYNLTQDANNKELQNKLANIDKELEAELNRIDKLKIAEAEKNKYKDLAEKEFIAKQNILTQEQQQKDLEDYNKFLLAKKEIDLAFEEQQRIDNQLKRELDFANKIVQMEIDNANEYQIQRELNEQNWQKEKADLQQQYADKKISAENYFNQLGLLNYNYVKTQQEIQQIEKESTLSAYADIFSNLGGLFEEHTTAYKAFATATIAIDTAVAIMKTMRDSSIPTYWLKLATSISVGLMGLAQIAKVNKVSAKNGAGSNVGVTTSKGTTTNTYKSDYAGGSMNGLTGNSQITGYTQSQTFSNSNETEAMRNAVKDGAKQGASEGAYSGSQQGLKDLSTDRQIQEDAKY